MSGITSTSIRDAITSLKGKSISDVAGICHANEFLHRSGFVSGPLFQEFHLTRRRLFGPVRMCSVYNGLKLLETAGIDLDNVLSELLMRAVEKKMLLPTHTYNTSDIDGVVLNAERYLVTRAMSDRDTLMGFTQEEVLEQLA